ncbi:hypothetical protein IW139_006367, partial [Coemansia sp. RSA 353]
MSAPAETQNLVFLLDDDITAEEKAHVKQSITNKGGKITNEPEIINAFFVTMPKQQNGFASLETLHEKISGVEVDGSVSTQK